MALEILATAVRQKEKRKEIKDIKIGKEEIKLSIFSNDTMLYTENPKGFTKKPLELINEFSEVAGQKINIQKLVAFHTPVMNYQKEKLRHQSYLQLHKKLKHLGINLTKEIKDLYSEKCKTLKKLKKIQINGIIYHATKQ